MTQRVTALAQAPGVRVVATAPSLEVRPGVLPAVLGAQLGLLADATEVLDPSGILVAAEDLGDGTGVRIEVSGAVAATPLLGVSWSTPLLQPHGGAHPVLPDEPWWPVRGAISIDELAPWSTLATPSNCVAWVAFLNGALSAATGGLLAYTRNSVAGERRVGFLRLSSGAWLDTIGQREGGSDATQSGVDMALGNGNGSAGVVQGITALPREGLGAIGTQRATMATGTCVVPVGTIPYLAWGVCQPTAGPGAVVDLAVLAELWPARLPAAR